MMRVMRVEGSGVDLVVELNESSLGGALIACGQEVNGVFNERILFERSLVSCVDG